MVVSNVLSGGLSVIMAYKGWGVWSLVWYGLSGTVIKVIMLWIISEWVPLFRFSIYSIKDIWKTALGFLNIGIINKVLEGLDSLFIGKVFNMAQLGFYNRAKALYELPMYTFLTPITRPFFPIFAKIQDELGEQRRKFYNTVEMLNFITLLGFGLLFILAKNWIVILYSDKWLESVAYFKVLIILIPFYPFNLLSTSLFKGNGKLKLLTIITAIDRAAVIFALIFGLKYGLLEFVYAFVVYKIFVFVFRVFFVQKYLKISSKIVVVSMAKMILIFIVIAVPLHYLNISNIYIETIVKTLIFSVSYMLIGYMFQIEGLLILYKELKNLLFSKK
jgi:O-antigen/teichoic acid export membrane protein